VTVLDPANNGPASSMAERHLRADYLDPDALRELGSSCAAVTTEFENVPAESLKILARHCVVSPGANSVAIAQNRILEKNFLVTNGFAVAPYAVIEDLEDLKGSAASPVPVVSVVRSGHPNPERLEDLFPGLLKVSRLGYDGKGQIRVNSLSELDAAFVSLDSEPCVLERMLPLECEVSVIVARGFDSIAVTFPVSENRHHNGILDVSIVPARLSPILIRQARDTAISIARKLDYHGVLCVEFFVLAGDQLVVNEIAPRPHNSGHYTID
jgi:5-(carboxyamino)imidazole ribonucleotide synthase